MATKKLLRGGLRIRPGFDGFDVAPFFKADCFEPLILIFMNNHGFYS